MSAEEKIFVRDVAVKRIQFPDHFINSFSVNIIHDLVSSVNSIYSLVSSVNSIYSLVSSVNIIHSLVSSVNINT